MKPEPKAESIVGGLIALIFRTRPALWIQRVSHRTSGAWGSAVRVEPNAISSMEKLSPFKDWRRGSSVRLVVGLVLVACLTACAGYGGGGYYGDDGYKIL